MMDRQTTDTVLMVEPVGFLANPQTRADNTWQDPDEHLDADPARVQLAALSEFRGLVTALESAGVRVQMESDTPDPATPDSIFPNNWFSTHQDATLVLYPMCAVNRRNERRSDIVERLAGTFGYSTVVDLTRHELRGRYLEGTGSMVLDRAHRVSYMCVSGRSDTRLLESWARFLGYSELITFRAASASRSGELVPVYHTNVLMGIGERTAVVCTEAIEDAGERRRLTDSLEATHHTIVEISRAQMNRCAGNVLQLRDQTGGLVWAMSTRAYDALTPEQRALLSADSRLIHAPIPVIERNGGGSVRCMLAEIFAPA